MLEQRVGIIFVIMSSFAFAFVPNSAKLALDDGASLFFIVYSRYIIGTILLTIFMIIKRNGLILQNSQIIQILLPSLSALVLIFCTYHAVNYVEVGVVLLILYMFPLGVALICFIQGKEQINGKQWLLMIAVFLGLAILLLDDLQSTNVYGLFISFCGLLSFIFFIILSSKQVSKLGSATFNLYLCFFGIIIMTITMMKSKIHGAKVTECDLHYEGSIKIDRFWMKKVGILPNEQVDVVNLNTGGRWTTYAIEGETWQIGVNGASISQICLVALTYI